MSNNGKEPSVSFDYDALDVLESLETEPDWSIQAELLGRILCWLVEANDLSRVGARVLVLALYLRPGLINQTSLDEISKLPNAPTKACLCKAMLKFQRLYNLKPSYYQKPLWMRERYRRAALAAHRRQE